MKKILLLLTLLFITSVSAQSFKAGVGTAYATDISTIGITANALMEIDKTWEADGSFTLFFEKDLVSWKVLNANIHYILSNKSDMKWYLLGGLNMTFYSVDFPEIEIDNPWGDDDFSVGGESSGSNFGFNLGIGGRKALSESLELFGQSHYTISDGSYLTLNVGVLFKF
ncbi:MAG: hypothetical protein ACEPO8_01415 [Rhodothermaceae bacterium]